jgi:2-polyprenyl-3-methyl-5-hydroxy-6-metoxy-1,4-benzoquinol methylase
MEPGSYKDPDGGIFYHKEKVYRWVNSGTGQFYQTLINGNFFKNLVDSHLFIPTWLANPNCKIPFIAEKEIQTTYFEHERLERISFPYEWPFAMLKDAAFHTLDLQHLLLKEELSLKDATPYNIQFQFTQPLFIDLCSIENVSKNGIWIAYNQFCQMFLYPLLRFIFESSESKGLFLSHMDGLTLDETVRFSGLRPFFKYGMIIDYLIPAIITKLKKYNKTNLTKKSVITDRILNNSAEIQLHSIRRLKKIIKKMQLPNFRGEWKDYADSCSYDQNDYLNKKKFVERIFEEHEIKKVLDIVCNTGHFSIIAAQKNCHVVALDSDHDCVNSLYLLSKEKKYSILPLWIDISNPSPAIGWLNTERADFISRYEIYFDCVFALALIHHLMITHRIPLEEIAKLLRRFTSRFLVVEYIGPEDSMFLELLKYRNEDYSYFNMKYFEKMISDQFIMHKKTELIDQQRKMHRCLYFMERRK